MMETVRIRVDRIAPEGKGIGNAEGSDKIVFVAHTLPGDRVEAAIVESKDRFSRGELLKVLAPSPSRIEPRCPYHFRPGIGDYCGGCDWQHIDYAAQLRFKRDIVLDCIKRIGKLQSVVLETLPSPEIWRYRNKVQVPFQLRPGPQMVTAGFYMPGSHRVVEFEDCGVQPELSVAILKSVRELAAKFGWNAYDEDSGLGWLRHLYLRTNAQGEALAVLVTRTPNFPKEKEAVAELTRRHPEIKSLWQNVQEKKTSVILGPRWKKLWGRDRMSEKLGSLALEFSPGAFLQVNTRAAEVLYRTAEDFLTESGFAPALLLDVYSGVGAIALWLARKAGRVIGVEEFPQAVEDAYHNARRLKVRNVNFVLGQAETALRRMRGLDVKRPWAAVLDPPRAGCEPGVLNFLSQRRIERVVYVSCNPATFARDAQRLTASGYRLTKVQPVDLFPQTSHVELVAQFEI